jgi:ATPase family associated with various cellular activities (AAA)
VTALPARDWGAENQKYLSAALVELRGILERNRRDRDRADAGGSLLERTPTDSSAALERVAEKFALTSFERDLLLLCAGIELDAEFARACRGAAGGEPTFGLALAALPGAHWSAITPTGPLRYWRLLELRPSDTLIASPLRVDERVLHYLAGVSHLDERLHGIIQPHQAVGELPAAHADVVNRIAAVWASANARTEPWPAVQLVGEEDAGGADIAAACCAAQGMGLCVMQASDLPQASGDRTAFDRLWAREAALGECGLLIVTAAADSPETLLGAASFAGRARSAVLLTCREPIHAPGARVARFDVQKPSRSEQAALWCAALSRHLRRPGDTAGHQMAHEEDGLAAHIDAVVSHFDFGPTTIAATSDILSGGGTPLDMQRIEESLWDSCRAQARGRLDDLAQRITISAGWDDLVLPPEQKQALREIVANVRQRATVYERWGFAAKSPRGLGISALFAGASGTGKTLAAEIVAHELRLDLYRIDLSQVVSKYIGETEKNLQRVFAAAETAGAVLLFDEADALFGKRSEVKDSHDRYANMEVSYLLQRMELYRGLAILTTNLQQALDPAFRRRLRFIVQFPFPDQSERAAIWERVFPTATPVRGIDAARLARLNVAGGNIRNIALSAAFLAADEGSPVTMSHLLRTARAECAKLGRPLTESEVGGWV